MSGEEEKTSPSLSALSSSSGVFESESAPLPINRQRESPEDLDATQHLPKVH